MRKMESIDISQNIDIFINGDSYKNQGRKPLERYASFDYCFNYFQSFYECGNLEELHSGDNIEKSCLQLSFYLASWGMYRGSTVVLKKSYKFYEKLIEEISQFDKRIWEIDVDNYHLDDNIALLLDCKEMIKGSFDDWDKPSDTFISKIMLGVFGCVPAFDEFFRKGFRVYSFSKKSLEKIWEFYFDNKNILDNYKIYTIDFYSGVNTKRKYTNAKIIDMIGFIEGIKKGR